MFLVRFYGSFRRAGLSLLLLMCCLLGRAKGVLRDTVTPGASDTLKFPIHDRYGDPYSTQGRTSFDLRNPVNVKDSIVYDPISRTYVIIEKVGNQYYRKPTYLTFEEFQQLQARKEQ
ncbi:MAG: hypothetical protein ACKO6K_02330, partial [Chitinophagaceae bacterium]